MGTIVKRFYETCGKEWQCNLCTATFLDICFFESVYPNRNFDLWLALIKRIHSNIHIFANSKLIN